MATGYRIDEELFLTPCGISQLDEYEFGATLVSAEIRSPEPVFLVSFSTDQCSPISAPPALDANGEWCPE